MSNQCVEWLIKFEKAVKNINVYDVYRKCFGDVITEGGPDMYESNMMGKVKIGDEYKTYKNYWTAEEYTPWAFSYKQALREHPHAQGHPDLEMVPPCVYATPVIEYLNDPTVR
jgi:hypothetical protein